MRVRRGLVGLILGFAVGVGGCGSDSPSPSFDNPFDPRNGQGLPVPDSLAVTVGNNLVRISWGLPDGESADEFAIFRQRLDEEEVEILLARVQQRNYTDAGVRNGRVYAYRLAAGRDGRFGVRSEAIEARPGVFSVVINDDAPKTRDRGVNVALNAPTADVVRLVENPDSVTSAPWRRAAVTLGWTLSVGDGRKTLYCVFRLPDGSESDPVQDAIILDTRATILSVDFEGSEKRQPGETLHFVLNAAEPDGTARVDVTGLITGLSLFDDGSNGDRAPGDGVYERDYVIPQGRSLSRAAVTGSFVDDVGNVAANLVATRSLTVNESPDAVTLIEPATLAIPPVAAAVTLRWTQAEAGDFSAYQVFRSESAPVDSSSRLVGTVASRTNTQITDSDVAEGKEYFYRVYISSTSGLQTGSTNSLRVLVPNERPPVRVNLESATSVSSTRLSLRWSASSDRDFFAYRIYRNTTGTVTERDSLVQRIEDVNMNQWDENGLTGNTRYYYRVFVEDTGGLLSQPSNEITATTDPEEIRLVSATPASPPEDPAVTLRWTQAGATNFSAYQVLRAEAPPVDDTSALVGTVTARGTLQFTDRDVVEGREYFYRVFVLYTSGPTLGSTNTLAVEVPNERPPGSVVLQPASSVSATRLSLAWDRSTDRDFAAYLVYRNETGIVTDADSLVARTTNLTQNYWDESNLQENSEYFYRVYVEDQGGLRSRSNEISVTTENEPPADVVLLEPTDVTSIAATLHWEPSADRGFALYRLYRDQARPVTTASTLVVELDERDTTSYRDIEIDPGMVYYYRIYVVDEEQATSNGSNTIEVTTPN